MPLTTAVIALPMARRTDLICGWESVVVVMLVDMGGRDVRRRERHPFFGLLVGWLVWFGLFGLLVG